MPGIDMAGIEWGKGPSGGIYLMGHDTTQAQVRRGGGGMLGNAHLKGWAGGKFIPGDVKTAEEALALTGLDWEVERRPIIKVESIVGNGKDGPEVQGWLPQESEDAHVFRSARKQVNDLPTGGWDIVPSHVMNVRQDTGDVLGVVGPGWRSPQNREAFAFMDALVDSNEARWLGGGMIDGGRRIWMCCQFDRSVLLGGDQNELSIPLGFVSNGWDGTLALSITAAPYRMACVNGQTIPLEGFIRTWKARHTRALNAEERLSEARRTLELSIGYFDAWTDAMERMMTTDITVKAFERVVRKLIPEPAGIGGKEAGPRAKKHAQEKRDSVLTIFRDEANLQHLGLTTYRALNAVTQFADWEIKAPEEKQMLRSAEPSKLKDHAYALLA